MRGRINLIRFSAINRKRLTGRTAVDYRAGSCAQPRENKSSIIDSRTTSYGRTDGRDAPVESSSVHFADQFSGGSRAVPSYAPSLARSSVPCRSSSITDAAERWAVLSLQDTDRTAGALSAVEISRPDVAGFSSCTQQRVPANIQIKL